jgi:TonB-dependent starch-binding outer membrane protein SusC
MKQLIATAFAAIVIYFPAFAQDARITGTVMNATGEALRGVSVTSVYRGVARGITTDNNGQFTLIVAPNSTLTVSYIGYVTKQVPVGDQTNHCFRAIQ